MHRDDVKLVHPYNWAVYGLPPKVGSILPKLLPSTKCSYNKQVEIVIAWQTSTGLSLGFWLTRLFKIMDKLKWSSSQSFLFSSTSESSHWSSTYFRTNHTYYFNSSIYKVMLPFAISSQHLPMIFHITSTLCITTVGVLKPSPQEKD